MSVACSPSHQERSSNLSLAVWLSLWTCLACCLSCGSPSQPHGALAVAPKPATDVQTPAPEVERISSQPLNPALVIRQATVLDVEDCSLREAQDVVVQGGVIVGLGPDEPIPPGARVIDEPDLVVLPGFIDTHTHFWQHVAKGMAAQASLQDWVKEVYSIAPYLSSSEMQTATRAAASEALLSGITSVIDFTISYHSGQLPAVARGLQASGMGGAFIAWKPTLFAASADADQYLWELKQAADGLEVRVGFGPLSFFPLPTVNDGVALARRNHLRMTEHTMENLNEQRAIVSSLTNYLDKHGSALSTADSALLRSITENATIPSDDRLADIRRYVDYSPRLNDDARKALQRLGNNRWRTAVPLLDGIGALDDSFVAIHAVWVSPEDMQLFAQRRVIVSHNPESNTYLASGIAPVRAYSKANIPVSLGTDGAASNDRISMFDAMRSAATLQKVRELDPEAPTACDVIQMATLNGAAALARSDVGAIAVGKEADIVVVSRQRLGLASAVTPQQVVNGLVYSATPRDIAYVISDGRVVVEKGMLVGVNEGELSQALSDAIVSARKRHASGAHLDGTWLEREGRLPRATWFSVLNEDVVDFTLEPEGSQRRLQIAFSGTLYGGNTPFSMAESSLQRFPADALSHFSMHELNVPPYSRVTVRRGSKETHWSIQIGEEVIERTGPGSGNEQVMLRWVDAAPDRKQ